MKRILPASLAFVFLLGLAACGGGGGGSSSPSTGKVTPPTTGTLAYVSPTGYQSQAGQFALVLDSASTSSNLVLDVVGPSGWQATGVTFAFDVDTTKATWSSTLVNGGAFTADNGTIARAWVAGKRLQGIVTYKGLARQVTNLGSGVIAKVSLTPVAGAATGAVTLTDAGLGSLMNSNGPPALPVLFSVGTLTLQ